MKIKKENIGRFLIMSMGLVITALLVKHGPIQQSEEYHHFVDNRNIAWIPNFWNVVSNLFFVIVGCMGIYKLKNNQLSILFPIQKIYLLLFVGILFVGFGSAFYHWTPTSTSLIFDRLPMTLTFMSLLAIVIGEYISTNLANKLIVPLLLIGLLSVVCWCIFGDLRLYVFIQFYPILAIPVILIFFKSQMTNFSAYWGLLALYVMAKLCEHFDSEIYNALVIISGHSLKHLMAAAGLYRILYVYQKRQIRINR